MDESKRNELILKWYKEGVSVAGITSLLYVHGLEGIQYQELRKYVQKELKRINSKHNG